ncbi:MAG: hypothetical protein KBG20_01880 [Caldilineaceae bacterium]|nr:hypothetical protein [Caldilineaceae bacterium]MBP8108011.1 hypothetical protein [Caldilineaceae bacterium]MBP8125191.1 hypothetical protein [Caldilineaceae bacterium]MBP9071012.1 hypothetical protein [Caldilineaceae bacterium]
MRILTVVQGEYGNRITLNIRRRAPADWTVESWVAPKVLPPVIDYPEEFLPITLPKSDLILSLGEHAGVAEFLPDIVQMTGAKAVLAPIDNVQYLPPGLQRQLAGWLAELGVPLVCPKPFCTLTENTINAHRRLVEYDVPLVAQFARYFGKPVLDVIVDEESKCVAGVNVVRDAACGCGHHVATGLMGISAEEAEYAAGMLHHHYPCLASMAIDPDYNDTLLHVSGNVLKDEVAWQVKPYKDPVRYLRPSGKVDDT